MKKTLYLLTLSAALLVSSFVFASKNQFQFQISDYATKRQGGQVLDVSIRYATKDGASYPDYRQLREKTLNFLEPTKDLPGDTFWEIIATKIGDELMNEYALAGVSVQLLTHPNETAKGDYFEPGFHGPIYTVGDVTPLSQVVMPAHK